ncbi:hypothetical protein GCM10018966_022410 [Streptomyces yanii]
MLSMVNANGTTANGSSLIDEILREGARRMPAAAPEAEVNTCIAELADERDEKGHRLVVRNGYHQPKKVTTAAGAVPAPEQFLGSAAGLSPAAVTRLTQQWQADHQVFGERGLSSSDYVHVWGDGIHPRIRLREAKSCALVLMGVRADGTKELIAMSDVYCEAER